MAIKRNGLGRGLDSLIPDTTRKNVKKTAEKQEEKKVLEKESEKEIVSAEISENVTNETLEVVEESPKAVTEKLFEISKDITNDVVKEDSFETKEESTGEKMVKISLVEPNREQPRKDFDEDSLLELSDSIKQFGVLQPLLVQEKNGFYELIAGERRWRAAKLAGIKEVPVVIKSYSNQEILEISLIENIQRENLNPIEEAMAYKKLLNEFSLKQDEVAERVSKSRTAVTNSMRLLKLSERVQRMIVDDMISTGHARALLAIDDEEQQFLLASKIFDEKLSVRETEKMIKTLKNPKKTVKKKINEHAFVYENLETKMKDVIGTKVIVNQKKNGKGKIEIEYYSEKELERIYDLIMSIHDEEKLEQ
ncbi:MAG: ParB/RepB/Spo0J family partition protein [Lachnospiraceae bacterium]|nr:ParB/RepB/Spo0J family partition protein [Lachnospiraceae bacterium]